MAKTKNPKATSTPKVSPPMPEQDSESESTEEEAMPTPKRVFPFQSTSGLPKRKPRTKSQKAEIIMPVQKILKSLKQGRYAESIRVGAAVYLAATLEYLVAETMELSGVAATDNNKRRISPRHIMLAIRKDQELNELCKKVTFMQGGAMPNIHSVLLPKKTAKQQAAAAAKAESQHNSD